MIKKSDMVVGQRLLVGKIKDGLQSFNAPPATSMLLTEESGGFFMGGVEIHSGDILEVVEGPKRRSGINTALVKVVSISGKEIGPPSISGYLYWCELRLSCTTI